MLNSYRVSIGELTKFGIEGIQVFLRPLELGSWPIEWVHSQTIAEQPPASQSGTGSNEA